MNGSGRKRVAVIGGGVSGLSAAQELADDFEVTVFERRKDVGGKAASGVENYLPTEHGFRFFPGFYWHVIETMKAIPAANGPGSVADHLVDLDCSILADDDGRRLMRPLPTGDSRPSLGDQLAGMCSFCQSMPGPIETAEFLLILTRLATSCRRRWDFQLEHQSWLEHVMSPLLPRPRSAKYRRLFGIGLTRSFVATRAEEMNARTGGQILLQLLYDCYFGPPTRGAPDRALDGPTSDVWIKPWHKYLKSKKVNFEPETEVTRIEVDDGRVSGISVRKVGEHKKSADLTATADETSLRDFDLYVMAVPCEVFKQLLVNSPKLVQADRELSKVFNLKTRWMNGMVFGIKDELQPPLPKGHILCLDSEWALTLLDQTKVWAPEHLAKVTPRWKTLLSVDISDWDSPGTRGLPAKWQQDRKKLMADVWEQLQEHLHELPTSPWDRCELDFDIQWPPPATGHEPIARKRTNDEPLLVNTVGSWANRPKARTKLPNLFMAGDFARTYTNFASMEAANEAARRAVTALREEAGIAKECPIRPLEGPTPLWFALPQHIAQRVDEVIYWSKLPLPPPALLPIAAWTTLGLINKLAQAVDRVVDPAAR